MRERSGDWGWGLLPVSLITAKEESTAKYRKELFCKMCQNKYACISVTTGPIVKYDIPKCIYISRENHFFDYILDQINTLFLSKKNIVKLKAAK